MSTPDLSDPIPLRLPVDVLQDVEAIAKACERSPSWVILRALRYYLLAEGAEIKQAAEGLEQIRNGDSHDAEDVLRELEEIVHGKVA